MGQFNLGIMDDEGRDFPQNDAEAVKWSRKAADQGYAKAQCITLVKRDEFAVHTAPIPADF